jgi:hypothetical protein
METMNGAIVNKKEYVSPTLKARKFVEKDIVTASGTKLSWGSTWGDGWDYFNEGGND